MSTIERDAERGGGRRLRGVASADKGLSAMLALLVILVFVVHPLAELGIIGRAFTTLFFSLVMMSGMWAAAGARRSTIVVGMLVAVGLAVRWLRLWKGSGALGFPSTLVAVLFCLAVALVVLAQVFRAGRITFHHIQGAVAVYLLLGLAWAFAYEGVALEWPAAFTMSGGSTNGELSHFVYFSFVTLTTVGYGDVTALHPVARSLVTCEALVGQLFPAILLARLVSMELFHRDELVASEETRG